MSITIRKVLPEDASRITELSGQLGYTITEKETLENIKAIQQHNDHDAFAAVEDDRILGWIHLMATFQLESTPACEIRGLVVDDQCRRKGIGKLLIRKAKEWASEKGRKAIRLRCNIKRTEAHEFYLGIGFYETKRQIAFEIKLR